MINQGRGLSLGERSPFPSEIGLEGYAYSILVVTDYTPTFGSLRWLARIRGAPSCWAHGASDGFFTVCWL